MYFFSEQSNSADNSTSFRKKCDDITVADRVEKA